MSADLRALPHEATSAPDFAEMVRQNKIEDIRRFQLVSYHQRLTSFQGQWAIAFDSLARDLGAPNFVGQSLTVRRDGCGVRHPAFPNAALIILYSEQGRTDELDSKVEEEGKAIMRGVRLESAPGQSI